MHVCVYSNCVIMLHVLCGRERYDKLISDKEKQQGDNKEKLMQLQTEYQQLLNKSGTVR